MKKFIFSAFLFAGVILGMPFFASAQSTSSVEVKVNGRDSITVPAWTNVTISWTSKNATVCNISAPDASSRVDNNGSLTMTVPWRVGYNGNWPYNIYCLDSTGQRFQDTAVVTATNVSSVSKPAPIPLITASANGVCQVGVSWGSYDLNTASGFKVYRDGVEIAKPGLVYNYQDSGLKESRVYKYTVRAVGTNGDSQESNPVSVSVGGSCSPQPTVPTPSPSPFAACNAIKTGTPERVLAASGYPWGAMYFSGNPRWAEIEWRIQNGIALLPTDLAAYYREYLTSMGLSSRISVSIGANGLPFAGPAGISIPSGAKVTLSSFFPTFKLSDGVFEYQNNIGYLGASNGQVTSAWFSPFSDANRIVCPLGNPLTGSTGNIPIPVSTPTPVTPPVLGPVVVSSASGIDIKANGSDVPINVPSGGTVNLTWSPRTNGNFSCSASGDINGQWRGNVGTSGALSVSPTRSTFYYIVCVDSAGRAAGTDSVSVTVANQPSRFQPTTTTTTTTTSTSNVGVSAGSPSITLVASQSSVSSGQPVSITWSSTGMSSCSSEDFFVPRINSTSGTSIVYPSRSTTFWISCLRATGPERKSVTINVLGGTTTGLTNPYLPPSGPVGTPTPVPTPVPTPTPTPTPPTINSSGKECSALSIGNPDKVAPAAGYKWGALYFSGNPAWKEIEWRIQNGIAIQSSDLKNYYTEYRKEMGLTPPPLGTDGDIFSGPGGISVPSRAKISMSWLFPTFKLSDGVFEYQKNIGFVGSVTGPVVPAWFSPFSDTNRIVCPLTSSSGSSTPTPPSNAKFNIGDNVITTAILNVRSSPSLTAPIASQPQPAGTRGIVRQGPVSANGYNWWIFSFYSGATSSQAWSAENYVEKVGSSGNTSTQLAAPTNFKATSSNVCGGRVDISWDTIAGHTYTLTGPGINGSLATNTTAGSFTAFGLIPQAAYQYKIFASNGLVNSETISSNFVSASSACAANHPVSVDLKVGKGPTPLPLRTVVPDNSSWTDGPFTIPQSEWLLLKWESVNAATCKWAPPFDGSAGWALNMPVSTNSIFIGQSHLQWGPGDVHYPTFSGTTYTLTCTSSSGQTATDSITVKSQ